jgi:hypothetical protein
MICKCGQVMDPPGESEFYLCPTCGKPKGLCDCFPLLQTGAEKREKK